MPIGTVFANPVIYDVAPLKWDYSKLLHQSKDISNTPKVRICQNLNALYGFKVSNTFAFNGNCVITLHYVHLECLIIPTCIQ